MRFDHQRAAAGHVACPQPGCAAQPGEPCRNLATGEELDRRPAHEPRLWAAGVLTGPSGPDRTGGYGPAYSDHPSDDQDRP